MSNIIRPTSAGVFPRLADGLHNVALGNGTQYEIMTVRQDALLCVGIVGRKCYAFYNSNHPDYIGDKLDLMGGDAQNMADFLSCQFGDFDSPKQGDYGASLCSDAIGREVAR